MSKNKRNKNVREELIESYGKECVVKFVEDIDLGIKIVPSEIVIEKEKGKYNIAKFEEETIKQIEQEL